MAKGKNLVMQTHLFFDIPGNQHGVKTIELKGAFEIVNRGFQLTMGNTTG